MVLSSKQVYVDGLDISPFQELLKNGCMEISKQTQQMAPLKCPRCHSINTKFCYYNNYSRSQPRYLCKSCKRHWTEGGTIRDVPVGGGRKGKRPAKTCSSSSTAAATPATTTAAMTSQQVHLPFIDGQENSIFPDVLCSVLQQPMHTNYVVNSSENSVFMGSLLSSSSLSYDQFARKDACGSTSINPFPISSSSGSSLQHQILSGPLEFCKELQTLPEIPSSGGALNILETTPSGYWSCWDDEFTGLGTPHP